MGFPLANASTSLKSDSCLPNLLKVESSNFTFSGCPPVNSASSTQNSSLVLVPLISFPFLIVGSITSPALYSNLTG